MQRESDDERLAMVKLGSLLFQFERVISEIIKDKTLFKNEHIYSLILEIWQTELKDKILNLGKEFFAGRYYQELKKVGLTGKQLDLKFSILGYFLHGELVEVDLRNKDLFHSGWPDKLPSLTKRIIDGFFDFFNSLLGSLQVVVPMVEFFKEFKDMVHFEIKHGSSATP
jgi:hypothetical protein